MCTFRPGAASCVSAAPEPGTALAGNYNECAQLSAVIIKATTNATRAVMFHLGKHNPQTVPTRSGSTGLTPRSATATRSR